MIGQSAPSRSLQRDWLIPQMCVLPFRKILTAWTNENLMKYKIGIWQVLYLRTNTVFQVGVLY